MAGSTFIAVGDSFTEGLQDGPGVDGHFVGWADRVAWVLADREPALRYANLAVRGKLLDEVVAVQLVAALAKRPDVLAFHAGGNDILRPATDPDDLARRYERAVERAVTDARTVVLFTMIERSGPPSAAADRLAARIAGLNEAVRGVASRHGAVLVDLAEVTALHDRRFWHDDRLHLSTLGHRRVAAAVLDALGTPAHPPAGLGPDWWRAPLAHAGDPSRSARARDDAAWVGRHLLPWIGRRLRGRSSGDGALAKRPRLARP